MGSYMRQSVDLFARMTQRTPGCSHRQKTRRLAFSITSPGYYRIGNYAVRVNLK